MAELFQNMFSDFDILEKLELGPNKKKYFTNSGIKLYLKHLLIESVKQWDCYIVPFAFTLLWLIWW